MIMDVEVLFFVFVFSDFLCYQYEVLGIVEYMIFLEVMEICINCFGELYLEIWVGWQWVEVLSLMFEWVWQFCMVVVNESNIGQCIIDVDLVVLFMFFIGQCVQFVILFVCDVGKVLIIICLLFKYIKLFMQYYEDGFFNQILEIDGSISEQDCELLELCYLCEYVEFFWCVVMYCKNIVVFGVIGSGKIIFMKVLVNYILDNECLVIIEDVCELFLIQFNVVYLLYFKGGQSISNVMVKSCMEVCLCMKFECIIFVELCGDEVFYFICNCVFGYLGLIISCYVGSLEQIWDQLVLMVKVLVEGLGLEFNVIKWLLMMIIDIVVYIKVYVGLCYIIGIDFNFGCVQGQEG